MYQSPVTDGLFSKIDFITLTLVNGEKYKVYGPFMNEDGTRIISMGETFRIVDGEERSSQKEIPVSEVKNYVTGTWAEVNAEKKRRDNFGLPQLFSRGSNKQQLPFIIFIVVITLLGYFFLG